MTQLAIHKRSITLKTLLQLLVAQLLQAVVSDAVERRLACSLEDLTCIKLASRGPSAPNNRHKKRKKSFIDIFEFPKFGLDSQQFARESGPQHSVCRSPGSGQAQCTPWRNFAPISSSIRKTLQSERADKRDCRESAGGCEHRAKTHK